MENTKHIRKKHLIRICNCKSPTMTLVVTIFNTNFSKQFFNKTINNFQPRTTRLRNFADKAGVGPHGATGGGIGIGGIVGGVARGDGAAVGLLAQQPPLAEAVRGRTTDQRVRMFKVHRKGKGVVLVHAFTGEIGPQQFHVLVRVRGVFRFHQIVLFDQRGVVRPALDVQVRLGRG